MSDNPTAIFPSDNMFYTYTLIIAAFLLVVLPISIPQKTCNKKQKCTKKPEEMSVEEQNNTNSSKNCGGCNKLYVPIAKGICVLMGIGILFYVSYNRLNK